jgi:hypothetical protein
VPLDVKEAFNFGYEPEADLETSLSIPWKLYDGLKGKNVWPKSFKPEWKKATFTYYGQVLSLGRRLMRTFALVLDLPETYFDHLLVRPGAIMRMLRYPSATLNPDHPGIGAHRDYECMNFTPSSAEQVSDPKITRVIARFSVPIVSSPANTLLNSQASLFFAKMTQTGCKCKQSVVNGLKYHLSKVPSSSILAISCPAGPTMCFGRRYTVFTMYRGASVIHSPFSLALTTPQGLRRLIHV